MTSGPSPQTSGWRESHLRRWKIVLKCIKTLSKIIFDMFIKFCNHINKLLIGSRVLFLIIKDL